MIKFVNLEYHCTMELTLDYNLVLTEPNLDKVLSRFKILNRINDRQYCI